MGKLIVFSGAGLSAESGLATFRDSEDGLWNGYKIEEVCHWSTWKKNFDAVHSFYNARKEEGRKATPNAAHLKIAEWQKRYETIILTQNVDPLLELAGCTDVVHLHGDIQKMRCTACGHVWVHGLDEYDTGTGCVSCGSKKGVKPHVVFFGEPAPEYTKLHKTLNDLTEDDVFVVIGTSAQVIQINHYLSQKTCAKILINLEPAQDEGDRLLDDEVYDLRIYEPATQGVETLETYLRKLLDPPATE